MKNLITLLMFVPYLFILGQNTIEEETYLSNNIVQRKFGLPIVREIRGGTKIIVSYEGNWTNEMKGSFEYACKLWEEAMPTTFPIRILAKLDNTTINNSLSKIQTKTKVNSEEIEDITSYTISTFPQIKGAAFQEFTGVSNTTAFCNLLSSGMFIEPDITITYFNFGDQLTNNCSFSLSEDIDPSQYDFVSIALRDLLKSFGMIWNAKRPQNNRLRINSTKISAYEDIVLKSLGWYLGDYDQAFLNATQGEVIISSRNQKWKIYAPNVWNADLSLGYFIPNDQQKLSQLLAYDFGRGTLVRDIADSDTYNFFSEILDWKGRVIVGMGNNSSIGESSGTTSELVPYKGSISINSEKSTMHTTSFPNTTTKTKLENPTNYSLKNSSFIDSWNTYHPNLRNDGSTTNEGWVVAILKKDGTWDIVYSFNLPTNSLTVSTANLSFHNDIEDYARTCDGYLRCRVTKAVYRYGKLEGTTYYYVLDHLPSKVKMAKSKVHYIQDDSYYRNVEIGLKDIEGATRITVEQFDEGADVPFIYEITDFKKGFFTATVDKDYSTTFKITAYNKNGSTSHSYTLPPLEEDKHSTLEFSLYENYINIFGGKKILTNNKASYKIYQLSSPSRFMNKQIDYGKNILGNRIDISHLPKGVYLLTITDMSGSQHSYKFTRN